MEWKVRYINTSCTTVKSWLKFVLIYDQLSFIKVFFCTFYYETLILNSF